MKRLPLMSSILALSLAVGTPAVLAHAGHGDEFTAEGGVDRVEVNVQTDSLLGIQVNPIEPNSAGKIMIPVTALVEDNGRQLVFVQYENFYEPVPVATGETQGELIEILDGVTANEQLVTQGSLSLYAESRKAQTAEAEPVAEPETEPAQANGESTPSQNSDIAKTETDATTTTTEASGGLPSILWVAVAGGLGVVIAAIAVLKGGRNKNTTIS